ncbi:NADH dehydrogenase subunit 6 (mitochondrion) [Aedes albopictus]|uniref:NADH-ubiquinone oxidoreductase chain 6 n=5 Tax=Culicinae TaxID=43817 RepID=Q5JCJ9_AEDAL|nr:NADH dehydrogenase subunit 6 [Aedes albopictus]AAL61969.1 NADH dehydrogenase subunit 6 [Aedes albopictus]
MIMMLIMLIVFIISFIFMQMKHLLAMGLMLLIQTFFTCLLTGMLMKTFWFSYVLFLFFNSGMLVLFIYVTSLSSNELLTLSLKISIYYAFHNLMFLKFYLFFDKLIIEPFINNNEMIKLSLMNNFLTEDTISLNKMYNFPTNLITLLLINYLFLTLLVTVKITKKNYGPLRPMN